MKSNKETDHRKTNPAAVYELKKVALKLRKNNKTVKEISEFTGLSDQTVRNLFRQYDNGGLSAIKPKTRVLEAVSQPHFYRIISGHNLGGSPFDDILTTESLFRCY